MKTGTHKKRARETGDDLWAWAERRVSLSVREDPPSSSGWYRGLLKKISGQKNSS